MVDVAAYIDIVTAGVCNGMNLTMQVGRSAVKAPWIMPTSLLFDGHRGSESPGSAHLIENGGKGQQKKVNPLGPNHLNR